MYQIYRLDERDVAINLRKLLLMQINNNSCEIELIFTNKGITTLVFSSEEETDKVFNEILYEWRERYSDNDKG